MPSCRGLHKFHRTARPHNLLHVHAAHRMELIQVKMVSAESLRDSSSFARAPWHRAVHTSGQKDSLTVRSSAGPSFSSRFPLTVGWSDVEVIDPAIHCFATVRIWRRSAPFPIRQFRQSRSAKGSRPCCKGDWRLARPPATGGARRRKNAGFTKLRRFMVLPVFYDYRGRLALNPNASVVKPRIRR